MRRAWIEISRSFTAGTYVHVALHAESVDRNIYPQNQKIYPAWSLSMRRAWIEICDVYAVTYQANKSLSMRRAWIEIMIRLKVLLLL